MISYLIPLYRVLQGIWSSWRRPAFRNAAGVLALLLVSGTFFYTQVEGWGVIDALYFSFTTLTTIGYGDLAPTTDSSKIFTIFYAAAGIGLLLKIIQDIAQPGAQSRTAADEGDSDGS